VRALVLSLAASLPLCACSLSIQRPVVTTEASSDLTQVTNSSANEIDPAVSPDGKAIAYAVARAVGSPKRIEVATLADTRHIVYTSGDVLGREPTWMPDSSGIVFVAKPTEHATEKLVQTFGQNEHRPVFLADVGNPNFLGVRPAVSPNGKVVAMSLGDVGVRNPGWPTTRQIDHGIGLTDLGGHGIDVISSGSDPAWSPDGRYIAFTKRVSGALRATEHLFIANADGSGAQQITDGTSDDQEPSWSPDGKHIVFCSAHAGTTEEWTQANLFVVRPDGSGMVQLTEGDRLACHPVWANDGFVYFHANVTNRFHIWRIRVRLADDPA
jgi:Tol biopolymer transport system component